MSINTSQLSDEEAQEYLAKTEQEVGLPCVDAVRNGVARLVDALP